MTQLSPPEVVRGMTDLDRDKFTKVISVPVLKVGEMSISFVVAVMKPYLLKIEKFKPIQGDETDSKRKLVFLNPDLVSSFDLFSEKIKTVLQETDVSDNCLERRSVTLTYDNWRCHDIIAAVLPPELKFSGFSVIGNIIHVNLKKQLSPYKNLIGQVLLEKMKNCKSVVCKVKRIQNTFRNLDVEVLAGVDDLKTEVKENGCRFELNFRDVYWNPRLHDEHARIVHKLREDDVLYDVFCGIGPFAIPAARTGCEVLANDLNPECCRWLRRNMALNKVAGDRLLVFNKSGDVFIREDVREDLLRRVTDAKYRSSKFHIAMNLPDTAHTFLPAFVGLFSEPELSLFTDGRLPTAHLYCFVKEQKNANGQLQKGHAEAVARKLVEEALDMRLSRTAEVLNVRNVAPNKDMVRVSFTLPREVLARSPCRTKRSHDETNLAEVKELRIDDVEYDGDAATNGRDEVSSTKRPKLA